MKKIVKIYVAGHSGLVGAAVAQALKENGFKNIITKSHKELDLLRQPDVEDFFKQQRPDYVILAAGKVGGIKANTTYPAQFIYENIAVQTNVIHSAYLFGVKKLLFFGSACCYPRECPQPMKEEYLLTAPLEPTNEPYAVAKIAGIKMCQAYNRQYGTNFISLIPASVYGPRDNFSPTDSHVIAALIRKFHYAKRKKKPSVAIWGTGLPRREFIYVEDIARACLFLMDSRDKKEIINVGSGKDISVAELAAVIKKISGFKGKIAFDKSKPDGMLQKLLDSSKITYLGWEAKVSLEEGISRTYNWYKKESK